MLLYCNNLILTRMYMICIYLQFKVNQHDTSTYKFDEITSSDITVLKTTN